MNASYIAVVVRLTHIMRAGWNAMLPREPGYRSMDASGPVPCDHPAELDNSPIAGAPDHPAVINSDRRVDKGALRSALIRASLRSSSSACGLKPTTLATKIAANLRVALIPIAIQNSTKPPNLHETNDDSVKARPQPLGRMSALVEIGPTDCFRQWQWALPTNSCV
jgi:hypothetical protein